MLADVETDPIARGFSAQDHLLRLAANATDSARGHSSRTLALRGPEVAYTAKAVSTAFQASAQESTSQDSTNAIV